MFSSRSFASSTAQHTTSPPLRSPLNTSTHAHTHTRTHTQTHTRQNSLTAAQAEMLLQSYDSFGCWAGKHAHLTSDLIIKPNRIILISEKSLDLGMGRVRGVHLIPESMPLMFNTAGMHPRCSEAQRCCQTHSAVSYFRGKQLFFSRHSHIKH